MDEPNCDFLECLVYHEQMDDLSLDDQELESLVL